MPALKTRSFVTLLLLLLVLVLLILLFFNQLAFSNLILARGDTFLYFYPYWHMAAAALQSWRVPLWNPSIFMGAPLLANSQMGFFYPLNWPLWLLFDTPYALSASILLHLFIAAVGSYLAGRRVMRLQPAAALVTALTFALGGYLTAQVEHINQLQGLAWLPWLLLVVAGFRGRNRRDWLITIGAVAFLLALQLLAGHMQTAFISAVALFIWILAQMLSQYLAHNSEKGHERQPAQLVLFVFGSLLLGGLAALLLAAVQLLPTLELANLSSRQGGLPINEVLSFSLHPLLLTRSLLPAYGQSLFSEYVALLPLTIILLAFIGAWQWRKKAGVLPAIVWIFAALFLALGAYNPINWLFAQLPGFNLFRVPARWLVVYTFSMALLSGVGWQILSDLVNIELDSRTEQPRRERFIKELLQPLAFFLFLFLLLAVWGYASQWLVNIIPTGPEAPYEAPSPQTLAGWVVEATLILLLAMLLFRSHQSAVSRLILGFLFGLFVVVLFLATRTLPYNNPTTPEAFFDRRSPITRLMSDTSNPADRFLSLSDIFFDPGDQAEINGIYADQLSPSALYDYTVTVKQKEIISPNLPMLYGLASIDGFDGGVLPLKSYTEQVKLLLPDGVTTTDGRLREHLDAVPEARWLDLFNMKYLITDKVDDVWRDGVFFDRQHPHRLTKEQTTTVGYLPQFEATELRLLASHKPGKVHILTSENREWDILPQAGEQDLYRVPFPEPAVLNDLRVTSCPEVETCQLYALTLFDARDDTFQTLVPGDYRLIHSGDVKIYENLDHLSRAFLVVDWKWQTNQSDIQAAMRDPDFDPRQTVILIPNNSTLPQPSPIDPGAPSPRVEIEQYVPEAIRIVTDTAQDAMLVLTDANYPGWQAIVDGQKVPLYQANGLFRAIHVPAGTHEVIFSFESHSFRTGLWLSLATLAIMTIILVGLLLSRRNENV